MQDEEKMEFLKERYELSGERIREIGTENTVPAPFSDYFKKTADFLLLVEETYKRIETGEAGEDSLEECGKLNKKLFSDVLPEQYEKSYANPAYAVKTLGDTHGRILSFLYTELRGMIAYAYEQRFEEQVILRELFIEIYDLFEEEELPTYRQVQQIVYWFVSDYSDVFAAHRVRESLDPTLTFATEIVMKSDLTDLRYLYRYGEYVSDASLKTAEFLNTLPEKEVRAMADTFTEGFRKGFLASGKDLSSKKSVNIRYHLGFERMIRYAVENFEKMGLKPILSRAAVSTVNRKQYQRVGYTGFPPNPQLDYDHREDAALYLDKKFMERKLSVMRASYEKYAKEADEYAGPALVDVFGEDPFLPEAKPEAYHFSDRQQEIYTQLDSESTQLLNRYVDSASTSFTIIAFPIPEIGERFEDIFRETVKVNTLDSDLYRRIQQKLIDALDEGMTVHIQGKDGNRTDLTVALMPLDNPEKESHFENCVADVNIPVGEVFTSPRLLGTNGVLHVKQVYLQGLNYLDLWIEFRDGMVSDFSCKNFESEEENRRYISENILFSHESLPMGEFAIGTNTTAYEMGKTFGIWDRLPILIAEKTGPHFALGDTCYRWEEDVRVFNPDGKEMIARENEVSALRREDPLKAYFGCHTDITIPYEEVGEIAVIREDGSKILLIKDGKFVLPGTEELNGPLNGI